MKQRVNKVAACIGEGSGRLGHPGIVCRVFRGSFAFQDKGSPSETLSLRPPPPSSLERRLAIHSEDPRPLASGLPSETSRKEHRSVILTQRGHQVLFSLRRKPGEAERMGPFICRRHSKEAGGRRGRRL